MIRKLLNFLCFLLYTFTAISSLYIVSKVVEVRSKCTEVKKNISSTLIKIKELKDENTRLRVEYYQLLRPEAYDKGSSRELKDLNEDQLEYVK